jgi:hypothetical protein
MVFSVFARVCTSMLLLLSLGLPVFAQERGNTRPDEPYPVVVEPAGTQSLYIGIDNPLSILVEGIRPEDLKVALTNDGTVTHLGTNRYTAVVTKPGTTYLEVYYRNMLIGKRTFRIKRIPDPTPMLNGFKGGEVNVDELLNDHVLRAVLEQYEGEGVCTVHGYKATVLLPDSDPVTFNVPGETLPQEVIDVIRSSPAGAKTAFFVDDIKVRCPGDSASRNIGSLAFKVLN